MRYPLFVDKFGFVWVRLYQGAPLIWTGMIVTGYVGGPSDVPA